MQVFNRHMKKYSVSLIIRETQIETNMSYYFAPLRMAHNKKSRNSRYYPFCKEKKKKKKRIPCALLVYWWENWLVPLLWKTGISNWSTVCLEIFLLSVYPKMQKTWIWRDIHALLFTATLFTITKLWKQSKYPTTDEWIKKYTYIYNWILLSYRKMTFYHLKQHGWKWRMIPSKINPKEKEKCWLISPMRKIKKQSKGRQNKPLNSGYKTEATRNVKVLRM